MKAFVVKAKAVPFPSFYGRGSAYGCTPLTGKGWSAQTYSCLWARDLAAPFVAPDVPYFSLVFFVRSTTPNEKAKGPVEAYCTSRSVPFLDFLRCLTTVSAPFQEAYTVFLEEVTIKKDTSSAVF